MHWSERPGIWVVARHADVLSVLQDPARFSSRLTRWEGLSLPAGHRELPDLQLADPPEHGHLRSTLAPHFTPRAVAALRERVQSLADGLLDRAGGSGRVDFMAAVARPLPVLVVSELLGLPAEDAGTIQGWADRVGAVIEQWEPDQTERWPAAQALFQYAAEAVEAGRDRPRGLMAAIVGAQRAGRPSDLEAALMCLTVLITSTQTPGDLLGNGARALLESPGALPGLAADPARLPAAVEELLRWDAPMQAVDRIATEEVGLGGRTIRPRQLVRVLIGSANRDGERFREPDRLDLARSPNPHLSLAAGPHHCLGAALGRLLGEVVFGTLAARFPGSRLAGSPVQRSWLTFRGLASLPMELSAG